VELDFYSLVLTRGGSQLMRLVSTNLYGPSVCTVRRYRGRLGKFSLMGLDENIERVS
jgi:hypothetical protein